MNNKNKSNNKNSNMIGYGSLFSKNKMGHLQILNMNNILVPITLFLFLTLHLRIQIKVQITLNLRWPLYYF